MSFFTTFKNLIQNYLKKDFRHEFPFLKDSLNPNPPNLLTAKIY